MNQLISNVGVPKRKEMLEEVVEEDTEEDGE